MFLDENPEITPKLYRTIRDRVKNKWGDTLVAYYGLSSKDHLQKMFELSSPLGWGKSELIKYDEVNGEGIFRTFDAPVGVSLKGNLKFFAEHLWRGITAGTASTILKTSWSKDSLGLLRLKIFSEAIYIPSTSSYITKPSDKSKITLTTLFCLSLPGESEEFFISGSIKGIARGVYCFRPASLIPWS